MENYSKYENIDIEKVCRICLTKKDSMSFIYDETGAVDMLLECASIQVTPQNGLFSLICSQCVCELKKWCDFKRKTRKAFDIARYLLDKKGKKSYTFKIPINKNNFKIQHDFIDQLTSNSQVKIILETSEMTTFFNENGRDEANSYLAYKTENRQTLVEKNLPVIKELKGTIKSLEREACDKEYTASNSYNRYKKKDDTFNKLYNCSKCNKSFKTSQVLSGHIKRHYDDRRYRCLICEHKFYAKSNLINHMRSHTGEKPFKCDICKKVFGTKASLKKHQIVHTFREKRFKCNICNKFFLTANSLEIHNHKHSGVKPFPCASCDKKFFTKETMHRHFGAIHDTDNNFLCSVCSKICSTKCHLNNHMKKKHLKPDKPLKDVCAECGKECGSAAELKVHFRVHTGERPYACDICDKRFIAKGNLNSHKHRHTGHKPYLCNQCGKTFAEKSTLKVHERIHTGEHPYKCNICGKSYIQSSALGTHLKQHWKSS